MLLLLLESFLDNLFNEQELKILLIASCVLAVLVIALVVLTVVYKRHQKRKLCTKQLESRREELLRQLDDIRNNAPEEEPTQKIVFTYWQTVKDGSVVEDIKELPDDVDFDEIGDENDDDEAATNVVTSANAEVFNTSIIAVADMTKYMRRHFELLDPSNDNKRFYAQFRYSFEAKLRTSDDETKARYRQLREEIAKYKGVKVRTSFKQERVTLGRKTLALILFRGKTLCIAFALNPANFAETKYRGIDKSDKKRFAKTPMLFKVTSDRKLSYTRYLFTRLAEENTVLLAAQPAQVVINDVSLPLGELYERQLVNITLLAEAPRDPSLPEQPEAVVVEPELDEDEETDVADFVETVEDQSDEDSDEEGPASVITEDGESLTIGSSILAVRQMTRYMRKELHLLGEEYDNKLYYAQCRFSFEAKLRWSTDEMKSRYQELRNELTKYKGVKVRNSFKQERIYFGKKTLGLILFRGKTLCVALALNPAKYAETKYHGIDMSDKKRFQATPMMLRVTSDRKLYYVLCLLQELAAENKIATQEETKVFVNSVALPLAEIFERKLVRITLLDEVPAEEAPAAQQLVASQPLAAQPASAEEPEPAPAPVEEEEPEAEILDEGDESDDEEEEPAAPTIAVADANSIGAIAVPAREMSDLLRKKLALTSPQYDDQTFYVQYRYGFEAKLRTSDDATKARYALLRNEIAKYKGLKVRGSFKQQRIYKGRNTLGLILFNGKTLCVAVALNPADYAETKYRGIDKTGKKRFADTPMLFKLTSDRRAEYVKHLFARLADIFGMSWQPTPAPTKFDVSEMSFDELLAKNLVRATLLGSAPDANREAPAAPQPAADIASEATEVVVPADEANEEPEATPEVTVAEAEVAATEAPSEEE